MNPHPTSPNRRKAVMPWTFVLATLQIVVLAVFAPVASAANTQPVQVFFLPLPEDQVRTSLYAIATATNQTMHSVTGISITGNGTVIYYDQWENGYELDIANPTNVWSSPGNLGGTQIWGDGNAANGCAPNLNGTPVTCNNANDVLAAGNVIILENDVTLPRNPATVLFDGRDKLATTKAVAMTRSLWSTGPGTLLADAIEVYDTTRWGTSFRIPVGQNLSSNFMFQYTGLLLMANQDGTVVQVDKDGNGTVDVTATINQGDSYQISGGINGNASITASKPVQVDVITGDVGSTYESRWFTIPPTEQWGTSYYTPVGTTSATYPANVWVYNPSQTTAITVHYQTKAGTGSFSVAAQGTYRYVMPALSGAHFWTPNGEPFLVVGTMDSGTSITDPQNQTFDWGYTLVPETWLTTAMVVGWAPGTAAGCTTGTCNGSPVWVTAVKPTTIYVKYDGNVNSGPNTAPNGLKYDVFYALAAFESKQIYDPDKNQTGMRVYTADGTQITGAWGEDPVNASPGSPYLDVGYTIPPLPQMVVSKAAGLRTDVNSNGQTDPGDTLAYTITVRNSGAVTLFGTVISETTPLNTTYVTGSTTLNGSPVADSGSTLFPLDEGGINVGTLAVGNTAVITYGLQLNLFPPAYAAITNTAIIETSEGTFTVTVTTPVSSTVTACDLKFTDPGGVITVSTYLQGGTVYVHVTDADQNFNTAVADTISAQVRDTTTGDYETLILTETGIATGIFAGSLPSSITGGQGPDDGTLYAKASDTLQATFSDTTFAPDTCNATATVNTPSETKVLYLSDPSQALDRVDPVATGDATTTLSEVLGGSSAGAINVSGAATTGTVTQGSAVTFSHSTGSGNNRLLLVGVSMECAGASCGTTADPTVSTVTFNGVGLIRAGRGFANANDAQVEIWYLKNPPASTTANIVATLTSGTAGNEIQDWGAGAITLAGVDEAQTLTPVFATGNATISPYTAIINITPTTGQWVFDTVAWDNAETTQTPGTNQTSRWSYSFGSITGNAIIAGAGSTKSVIGAPNSMSWTGSATSNWAIGALAITPGSVTGVAATTFTQTVAMASDFAMPVGGAITVTTYISGSLGANGAKPITATLRYGGTAFATLTNGTYNSGAGTLVWTGSLGSNTTVPAGQAISLTVTSGVTNTFQIHYDSSTYPSKIQLPTTTVIDVASLGIYSAAYPGGTLLTGATNGDTVYVRSTVTDPFGWSDVPTATLRITDPSNNLTTVALIPTYRVATTTLTTTLEYPWVTPGTQGNYTITLTADEGYEGISDTASTPFNLTFQDLGTPCSLVFIDASGAITNSYGTNATVYLRCNDGDRNLSSGGLDTITATLTSSVGDREVVTLTETAVNTGVFTGTMATISSTLFTQGNGTLSAPIGATLNANYTDVNDPADVCTAAASIRDTNPRLSLSKTLIQPADGSAVVGELVRFDVAVANPGPTTLLTATLTDTFPSLCLAYQSASVTPSSVVTPTLVWSNLGPIPSGGSTTVSLYFVATAACSPATNSVLGSARDQNNAPVTAGPVTATVITTQPQLALSKEYISGTPVVNNTVTFRIHITNTGSTTITNLPLQDTYSASCIEYQSATPAASGAGGGIALWNNLGPLAASDSTSVDVTFRVAGPCNPALNTAVVDSASDEHGDSVPPVQGSASVTTMANPPQIAVLKLLTAPPSGTAYIGDAITYTVRISNTGPNAITTLTLTDTFNSICQAVTSWGAIAPTQTSAGQAVWNTLIPTQPPLLPGEAISLTLGFQAVVPTATCTNTVTLAGQDRYGQAVGPLNRQASVTVGERPLIGVAKALVGEVGSVGGGSYVVTYTLKVQNYGDVLLSSVQVTDALSLTFPSPVIFAVNSVTATAGLTPNAAYNGDGNLNLLTGTNSLAVGASGSITFTVTITPELSGPGPFNNQARARGTGPLGTTVYDLSQNGVNPDLNGNNDPTDDNAPTPLTLAQIFGHIFEDTDGGGTQNGLEPNLSGIQVVITDSLGVTRTVTTDASGNYTATVPSGLTFADVVEASLPAGYAQTAGVDPNSVEVPSGSATDIGDDGYQPLSLGVIAGVTFVDTNQNGTRDPGEDTMIPFVPVSIVGLTAGGAPVSIITTTTSITGAYRVDNLLPGTYTVTTPSAHLGWPGSTAPQVVTLTVPAPERLDVDFGYVAPTAVRLINLVAAPSRTAVRLSWFVLRDATTPPRFQVWRVAGGGGWKQLTATPVDAISQDGQAFAYLYSDTAITPGVTYLYRLESLTGESFGPWPVRVPAADDVRRFLPLVGR